MLKFNNNHIFTGYLKQFLHEFNLPTCKIYSMDQYRYHKKNNVEKNLLRSVKLPKNNTPEHIKSGNVKYIPYIKDNNLQIYLAGSNNTFYWSHVGVDYFYNKPILGYTKNLIIKDSIYDSYTHEYLGDFLRFQRDYNDLNLMSLYNCFSGRISGNCYAKITGKNEGSPTISIFDGMDKKYKIFILPVKLFNSYTIAIDCNEPIELCCTLYGKYQDTTELAKSVANSTYTILPDAKFNHPFIYDKLTKDQNLADSLALRENDLKLLIKVPFNNSSSLVVLEGNYLNYNDMLLKHENTDEENIWKIKRNHTITNYEEDIYHPAVNKRLFDPISSLQLLNMNTGESYPFADRLIEYMVGNVITDFDPLEDDIQRTQTVMSYNGIKFNNIDIWENKVKNISYDFMFNHFKTLDSRINHDLLGYIDKDVEANYKSILGLKKVTISNVDIYPEMYNKETK